MGVFEANLTRISDLAPDEASHLLEFRGRLVLMSDGRKLHYHYIEKFFSSGLPGLNPLSHSHVSKVSVAVKEQYASIINSLIGYCMSAYNCRRSLDRDGSFNLARRPQFTDDTWANDVAEWKQIDQDIYNHFDRPVRL